MRKTFAWLFLLTLIVLLFFWKLVFTKQFSVLWQWEIVNQHYAWYTFAAKWIQQGIIPLWDPYRYGGNSFIGEMQAGLFYPFKLALYLAPLNAYGLLSERVFNVFYVFSHWLAAVSMFCLARWLKLSRFASLVAAICFGLGGFVLKAGWPNILDAMPWLPLVVLFLLRACDAERTIDQIVNACLSGLALGMTFLAGSLHIAVMDGVVVVTLATYLYIQKRGRQRIAAYVTLVAIVALVSVAIGAVQLWPSMEYGPRAYRWVGMDAPIRSFEKIPYAVLGDEANFGPESLFAFVLGDADTGNHEPSNYLGVLPLLFVIIGVWKNWREPLVRYFAALALGAYVYSWGSFSFLHGVLYLGPFLDMAREPGRFIYLTQFAMAILAGFGVRTLFEERPTIAGLTSIVKWAVILFAVLLAAASLRLPLPVTESTYLSFFFLAAAYAILLASQRTTPFAGTLYIVVFLILWDLYSFNPVIQSKIETQKNKNDYLARLIEDRNLASFFKARPTARVQFDAPSAMNVGDAYGIPVTWAMSATLLVDYAGLLGHPRENQMLNVAYTIRSKDRKGEGTPVYSDEYWDVYENADASPRAWFVHDVEVDTSTARPLPRLNEKELDLQRTALISEPLNEEFGPGESNGPESIEWLVYEPNRVELKTDSASPALLVVSEVFYPGWVAEVDGARTAIHQVDGVLRGIPVGGGMHHVVMRYEPRSVRWGAIITIFSFLGICVLVVVGWRNGFGTTPSAPILIELERRSHPS